MSVRNYGKSTFGIILISLVLALVGSGQTKKNSTFQPSDFAGTWVFDDSKGSSTRMTTNNCTNLVLTISVDDSKLTISRKDNCESYQTIIYTDSRGEKNSVPIPRNSYTNDPSIEITSKTTIKKNKIVRYYRQSIPIHSQNAATGYSNIETTEEYILSRDSQTLTVKRTTLSQIPWPNTADQYISVFRRQK